MTSRADRNPVATMIEALLAQQKRSMRDVCAAGGLGESAIKEILSGKSRNPRIDTLLKLQKGFGLTDNSLVEAASRQSTTMSIRSTRATDTGNRAGQGRHDFQLSGLQRDLPVYGTAAGSVLTNGAPQTLTKEAIDFVRRPPALEGVRDAFAIYVVGESMEPRYRAGDLVFVHPKRPVRPHDDCVITLIESEGQDPKTYIKTFLKRDDKWLVTRQYNPESELKFSLKHIQAVQRILTMNELFGV